MRPDMPAVAFVTMGCAKNEVDSQTMAALLSQGGYRVIDDLEAADAVIVNTCSFIQMATEESIDAVLAAAELPSIAEGRGKLILAGCMAARYGEELEPEFPEAAAFVPCAEEEGIVAVVDGLFGVDRANAPSNADQADLSSSSVSAYVKISDGCDRFCSYCTIPFIRGRYHSFSLETIEADVRRAVEQGNREVVLIAQDTGRWGSDLTPPSTLAQLASHLAEEFPDTWFRLLYIQPEGVTEELIDTVARHPNLCDYFDIPFQHSDPALLKAMNRSGSGEEFLELIGRIRQAIPQAALRTTLIVGFPGESEESFEGLLDFVQEAALDYVGAFAYSREEGTRAYSLDGQIPEEEKQRRLQELRDVSDALSGTVVAQRIGTDLAVLVEGCEEDSQLFGRCQAQAPDVDGVTYVDKGMIGQVALYRIDQTLGYEMEGSRI